MGIPANSTVFNWQNVLNNAPLPNRIYVAFIFQSVLYGNLNHVSTYFEDMRMQSFNVKLNGRDLLVEPIRTNFIHKSATAAEPNLGYKLDTTKSDARHAYLSLLKVLNQVSDQSSPLRLKYSEYLNGNFFYAVELGKSGEKTGSSGSLDLEVEFNDTKTKAASCVLVFSEKTETACFVRR
jgi:hypothetical protein